MGSVKRIKDPWILRVIHAHGCWNAASDSSLSSSSHESHMWSERDTTLTVDMLMRNMKCTNVTQFTGDTRCKHFILATWSSENISNPRRDHSMFNYIETFNWKAARQVKSATLPHHESHTITFTVMFNTHWTLWVARKSSTSAHFQWDVSQMPQQLIPIWAPWKKKGKHGMKCKWWVRLSWGSATQTDREKQWCRKFLDSPGKMLSEKCLGIPPSSIKKKKSSKKHRVMIPDTTRASCWVRHCGMR